MLNTKKKQLHIHNHDPKTPLNLHKHLTYGHWMCCISQRWTDEEAIYLTIKSDQWQGWKGTEKMAIRKPVNSPVEVGSLPHYTLED